MVYIEKLFCGIIEIQLPDFKKQINGTSQEIVIICKDRKNSTQSLARR